MKKLLLNLEARLRNLESEAITVAKRSPTGNLLFLEKIGKFRAKWQELISNA